jgi:hypothetical protein
MSVRRADDFIADVERQYEWYGVNAGWNIAERYLEAVQAGCQLLEGELDDFERLEHPLILAKAKARMPHAHDRTP